MLAIVVGCAGLQVPPHRGPVSEHFDGERFFNPWLPAVDAEKSPWDVLRWRLTGSPGPWPEWVVTVPGVKPPERVAGGPRFTFVGHATVLVQAGGVNVLTDPVWSHQVGPSRALSVRRRKQPGLRFEELPKIDAVVISHNHYDHLDLPTLRRLVARDRPRILAGLGTARFLAEAGIVGGEDLDWWQSTALGGAGVRATAVPAQHWSLRWPGDARRALWAGWVLHTPGGAVYFAGDTGYGDFVRQIRERLGPLRYGLIPIGAYLPRWFMRPQHVDPAEAVRMHRELGIETTVPIHYGTFRQADEAYGQETVDLRAALADAGLGADAFRVLREGESWEPGAR